MLDAPYRAASGAGIGDFSGITSVAMVCPQNDYGLASTHRPVLFEFDHRITASSAVGTTVAELRIRNLANDGWLTNGKILEVFTDLVIQGPHFNSVSGPNGGNTGLIFSGNAGFTTALIGKYVRYVDTQESFLILDVLGVSSLLVEGSIGANFGNVQIISNRSGVVLDFTLGSDADVYGLQWSITTAPSALTFTEPLAENVAGLIANACVFQESWSTLGVLVQSVSKISFVDGDYRLLYIFNKPVTGSVADADAAMEFNVPQLGGIWVAPSSLVSLFGSIGAIYAGHTESGLAGRPWRILSAPTTVSFAHAFPLPQSGVIADTPSGSDEYVSLLESYYADYAFVSKVERLLPDYREAKITFNRNFSGPFDAAKFEIFYSTGPWAGTWRAPGVTERGSNYFIGRWAGGFPVLDPAIQANSPWRVTADPGMVFDSPLPFIIAQYGSVVG